MTKLSDLKAGDTVTMAAGFYCMDDFDVFKMMKEGCLCIAPTCATTLTFGRTRPATSLEL